MTPSASSKTPDRLSSLETTVAKLATTVEGFIGESIAHRKRVEGDQQHIWQAVEKIATKGQISWGMVVTTGGFILGLALASAALINALTESRIRQLENRMEFYQRDIAENRADVKDLREKR